MKIYFNYFFFRRSKVKYERYISAAHKKIAISYHTKNALLAYFPHVPSDDVNVYYSPDVSDFEVSSEDEELSIYSDYYLMVSGNRWLKNNMRAITALDQLFSERPSLRRQVVVTGVNSPNVFLNRLHNREYFIFLEYVSESLLKELYRKAYCFIYPSLNEGFGYPPLEAMKYGVPTIASSFTSIPEVCGDAVLYINPLSIGEIKTRILQLEDKAVFANFSKLGTVRYNYIAEQQKRDLNELIKLLISSLFLGKNKD